MQQQRRETLHDLPKLYLQAPAHKPLLSTTLKKDLTVAIFKSAWLYETGSVVRVLIKSVNSYVWDKPYQVKQVTVSNNVFYPVLLHCNVVQPTMMFTQE